MKIICLALRIWCASAILAAISYDACAIPISHTYDFAFSNFEAGAPLDPVLGSVSVTFDSGLSTTAQLVDAINLTISGHSYAPSEVAFNFPSGPNVIFIYGLLNGTAVVGGTNDFFINFNVVTFQGQTLMDYAVSGGQGPFFSSQGVVSERRAVPEPATLPLIAIGSASLGFAAWRRRRLQ
jgi:hypothetical protein